MKTALLLCFLFPVILQLSLAQTEPAARNEQDVIHPPFQYLDKTGQPAVSAEMEISISLTCGQCHDTLFINSHSSHHTKKVKAECTICHFRGGMRGDSLESPHLRIAPPTIENCRICHGVAQSINRPIAIPRDYGQRLEYVEGKNFYDITQKTGVILASHDIANSLLNVENKDGLSQPWDVHIRRQLGCIGCHMPANSPQACLEVPPTLGGHLKRDPRRMLSPGQYIKRPDHRLKAAQCTCCHDPFAIHGQMPYKQRHLTALSCQSCHVPKLFGPALQTVDATVLTASGSPRLEIRGADPDQSHGDSLNTQFQRGFQPALLSHASPSGAPIISPFNLTTEYYWIFGKDSKKIPMEALRRVLLQGDGYRPEINRLLDKNNDGKLQPEELKLDEATKVSAVAKKLEAAGFASPRIAGMVRAFKITHGVTESHLMTLRCSECHGESSRFGEDILLSRTVPAGVIPAFAPENLPALKQSLAVDSQGRLVLNHSHETGPFYIFGHSRRGWLDSAGIALLFLTLLAILAHGGMRVYYSRKFRRHRANVQWVYMYSLYERIWHWTMAGTIIILALTGLEIHYAGKFGLLGLGAAVTVHNVLAAVLVLNAGLSLFFHIATGQIRQFFGFNRKFIQETIVQAYYYISGIFRHSPHPVRKTVERKLNPLQQLTYIGLLNVLMPFQIITGALIWAAGTWHGFSGKIGGLAYLGPAHNLASWLFLSFLAAHLYLSTTGHTPLSNLRAMLTGYDQVEADETGVEHKQLMEMPVLDLMGSLLRRFSGDRKKTLETGEQSDANASIEKPENKKRENNNE